MSDNLSNAKKICELCNTNPSKYCCPKCNILYCSLDCYKSNQHTDCSESFYRECVNEELSSYQADGESKKKMIEILQKLQSEDLNETNIEELTDNADSADSDDEEQADLHQRIEGLNLNDADALWNAMTEDERNEFEALLNQGDVGSIVPLWEPWWMYRREKKLVEDMENNNEESEKLKNCPALKVVTDISSLTKLQPSPVIRFNITNVLASYAFIMRYFNGEVDATEATVCVLYICANLDTNTNFDDFALAVESVAQKCLQSDLIETDVDSIVVLKNDTLLILQGPSEENNKHYCKAALSHLHSILSDAKSLAKQPKKDKKPQATSGFSRKFPEHNSSHLPMIDVSKLKKCIKKIEYYLSYVDSCSIN